jgi:predicted HTH domain antitoxin
MTITVELPDDLASHENPSREALEALAIEGYRSGALSTHQTRVLLGFETRYELDGFLKAHNVWEHSYGLDDYRNDIASLQRLDERGQLKG